MFDIKSPKVFISYSWDDVSHKSWVKELASHLRSDGVDVTIDRWGVAPGGQLPEYMERSIRENDYVLIVCTPQYKSRSDNRSGGVGYEGDIMTGEVFVHRNHSKFIPLLRRGEWKDSAPSWLQGKAYIDFREDSYSEVSYKELYDHLFDQREKAPPLGKPKGVTQEPNFIVVRYAENDKDFALWLSFQLINHGYPVWCDLLDSEPGEYSQAMAEKLIKNEAVKYIFVFSSFSNVDAELLKELRFAYEVMQSNKLVGFVVPVQVVDIPEEKQTILLQGTSPIDFSQGWSGGLDNLLKYLEKSGVAKDDEYTPSKTNNLWRLQFGAEKGLKNESEELLSNWFPIHIPEIIYFHELQRNGIGLLAVQSASLPFSAIQLNQYLVTFAKADDFLNQLGFNITIKNSSEIALQDFLDGNYDQKFAKKEASWNLVGVLTLQTSAHLRMSISELLLKPFPNAVQPLGRFLSQSNLQAYLLANNRICYYFPIGFSDKGDNKSYYQGVDGKRSWRSLAGKHKKNFWHFGIQGRATLYPEPAFIVKTHGLASSDGINIWQSKESLHAARRRWFKNWWNVEWRDRLLAAMAYIATGSEYFEIPLGADVSIRVSSFSIVFQSPVRYTDSRDEILELESEDDGNMSDEDDEEYDYEIEDEPVEDDV
jgi:hypothetical protein